jgi:hypothetical protein
MHGLTHMDWWQWRVEDRRRPGGKGESHKQKNAMHSSRLMLRLVVSTSMYGAWQLLQHVHNARYHPPGVLSQPCVLPHLHHAGQAGGSSRAGGAGIGRGGTRVGLHIQDAPACQATCPAAVGFGGASILEGDASTVIHGWAAAGDAAAASAAAFKAPPRQATTPVGGSLACGRHTPAVNLAQDHRLVRGAAPGCCSSPAMAGICNVLCTL